MNVDAIVALFKLVDPDTFNVFKIVVAACKIEAPDT